MMSNYEAVGIAEGFIEADNADQTRWLTRTANARYLLWRLWRGSVICECDEVNENRGQSQGY